AAFVERLRIDEACHRLSTCDNSVEDIAVSVGFKSAATFRRAFQRRLGINPNDYRRPVPPDGQSVHRLLHNRQKVQSFSRAASMAFLKVYIDTNSLLKPDWNSGD